MRFAVERLGSWCDESDFVVDAGAIADYAAATNDPDPSHRAGLVAPPSFAVLATWEPLKCVVGAVAPPEASFDILHGEQDIHVHRPLVPGMVLRSTGTVLGVHVKSSGTTMVKRFVTHDTKSGDLVLEQFTVSFFRNVFARESGGEQAPDHRFPDALRAREPVAVARQTFDDDQTFRFAKASGDDQRFHLDDAEARDAGFPGIIVQGMCTTAFACWAAVEQLAGGDSTRVTRLAVRLARPVRRAASVTTRFYDDGARDGRRAYCFETADRDGAVVLRDGRIEIVA